MHEATPIPDETIPRSRWNGRLRTGLLAVIGLAIGLFLLYGPTEQQILDQQAEIKSWVDAYPILSKLTYFLIVVTMMGLSIPSGAMFSVLGGFLFGRGWGILIISFATTTGAVIAFLSSRYLLRESLLRWMERRPTWHARMQRLDNAILRDGKFALLMLRLTPVMPYFVLNFAMGLTAIRLRTYWWVSQVGMLPCSFVYVNAGASVRQIHALRDLISLEVILSLVLLFVIPIVLRYVPRWLGWRMSVPAQGTSAVNP
ncbi:TVP38/TMEM64 family protein [Tuwongella immobilis]|uniref:TVP38/TMEM64 family membrane protein n=1 Tax=Tuwongella immobilis TaxID=692036 RepID=A0A6C2YT84_9BACT|nr:TVP38/TMEM64 family protein [Tuwongella immobilis]VIP04547.1 mercuric reductase : Uncharacterized protein OS=Vibrio cholerae HC-02C1 GN=VCHC02C1_1970 PE=4 SV=1: SNARE_assoc [Tuwongella immobilis]VTS06455.1 mercuric reductase : Uncharacterized protein OS=Vibrio cholerae HC-02C1 GN=VCHC02C1_1970 PE=4 SV=1: SNARE_assoc [Tuwongella immobilis]